MLIVKEPRGGQYEGAEVVGVQQLRPFEECHLVGMPLSVHVGMMRLPVPGVFADPAGPMDSLLLPVGRQERGPGVTFG